MLELKWATAHLSTGASRCRAGRRRALGAGRLKTQAALGARHGTSACRASGAAGVGGRGAQARGALARGARARGRRAQRARAAWALGARAGQGCALGALGLFFARFDSIFFQSQIFGHCS